MPQIYDMGPTALLPFRRKAKNPTASAGFEPANLGSKGQHATSRPPKPVLCVCVCVCIYNIPPNDGLQICPKHLDVD